MQAGREGHRHETNRDSDMSRQVYIKTENKFRMTRQTDKQSDRQACRQTDERTGKQRDMTVSRHINKEKRGAHTEGEIALQLNIEMCKLTDKQKER